ncbi:MAG: helix-turn-helix transcriptional regulator [Lachnospiraceae bacterium]|nr:helix-turn-helix transcriptional regulator [Lachnospiraceae bacterium]
MTKKENPLRQLPENMLNCGKIRFKLAEIMKEKEISMNQLSFRAEMQRTQLRNYRDNKLQRLDIDILLRLCYVLDCDLHDLIEYIPPEEQF